MREQRYVFAFSKFILNVVKQVMLIKN